MIKVRHLRCVVTVRSGSAGAARHKDGCPQRPSLDFAMPVPVAGLEEGFELGESASEVGGEMGGAGQDALARRADARAVADRVYALMKREVAQGRT